MAGLDHLRLELPLKRRKLPRQVEELPQQPTMFVACSAALLFNARSVHDRLGRLSLPKSRLRNKSRTARLTSLPIKCFSKSPGFCWKLSSFSRKALSAPSSRRSLRSILFEWLKWQTGKKQRCGGTCLSGLLVIVLASPASSTPAIACSWMSPMASQSQDPCGV